MRYSYCNVCRGDDRPFVKCVNCKKVYHYECVKIATAEDNWVCYECTEDTESANKKRKDPLLQERFRKSKAWSNRLLLFRGAFIHANCRSLEFCCDTATIDSYLSKKTFIESSSDDFTATSHNLMSLPISKTPEYITNATVRDYQLDGISTICSWYLRGVGGILADEMGLGKTLQTITFLGTLKHRLQLSGPHLVVTPLAVLQNWANELNKFCPSLTYKKVYGSMSERRQILCDERVISGWYDVYLTTYETVIAEEAFFVDSWSWVTVTIDEGQRIKNENTALRLFLSRIKCPFRLLLTGTPLQNNLHELWALLNYIAPEIFNKSHSFDNGVRIADDSMNHSTCVLARTLLEKTMMIRRVKRDVETSLLPKIQCKIYVPMTDLQQKWYQNILSRAGTLHLLSNNQLYHVLSQLWKVVNHPKQIFNKRETERRKEIYRLQNATNAGAEFITSKCCNTESMIGSNEWTTENELRLLQGETLIKASGKLAMLDRLLLRLKDQKSRVLVFSQYTETLDILEEYAVFRFGPIREAYLRLDGQTNRIIREMDVRAFNAVGSKIFIYFISTKAGGVGINLATADSVVLYDSCWNPQVDLQAQDRAHRIGQEKQVTVYRLITPDTFEERVCEMSERKMLLDHVVIAKDENGEAVSLSRKRKSVPGNKEEDHMLSMSEMVSILNHGTERILKTSVTDRGESNELTDEVLDAQLDTFITNAVQIKSRKNKEVTSLKSRVTETNSSRLETAPAPVAPCDSDSSATPVMGSAVSDNSTTVPEKENHQEQLSSSSPLSIYESRPVPTAYTLFFLERKDAILSSKRNIHSIGQLSHVVCREWRNLSVSDRSKYITRRDEMIAQRALVAGKPTVSTITTSHPDHINKQIEVVDLTESSDSCPVPVTSSLPSTFASTLPPISLSITVPPHLSSSSVCSDKRVRKPPKVYSPVMRSLKRQKKARSHEDTCFCCNDGGMLIECAQCPKVYHLQCLAYKKVPEGIWSCPWHCCIVCDRITSNSGGMQFRCLTCPITYCFDCWPVDQEMAGITPNAQYVRNYEKHGYEISKNTIFYKCKECKIEYNRIMNKKYARVVSCEKK